MELKHLNTYLTVARHMSFTRAAQELDYVQSSVTAHIKALETDLGVPLFERLGRRVTFTDAGRELLPHAQQLIHQAERARDAVQGIGADPRTLRGTLRIAAPESLCAHLLPPVLRALMDQFPLLRVTFGPADRNSLLTSLGDGTLDAGFLLEERLTAPMATAELLARQELTLITHPAHPLLKRSSVHTADLAHETLLLIEAGCAQRDVMERELHQAAIQPATMEFVSIEALKRCAAAGLGIALLPQAAVSGELIRGEVAALPWSTKPVLGIHYLIHKDRRPTTVLTTLADLARRHWNPTP
ncbi:MULTISPECIES: LysR family transcriptional regulator [Streptomyces]|uniref:LysR family transcriptional regulator n=1 Tax=Streptomyces lycopersici TaxID=2974589 RepID=UPI0021D2B267|nr:LysR family transcriptional regulator [Streptomyces sp. NEAU-383]